MNHRILIVDHERHVGTLLAHTLDDMQDAGVELVVVDDPRAAVAHAREAPPDLAFVDHHMPSLNGTDLCRLLRELHPDRNLSLVLLADKGQLPSRDVCSALRITCVEKPFDPDRIRALACAALGFEYDG